jgi:hypothetical protein
MILANLGCYKLKATSGIKATSPAGAKRCTDSYNPTHLVTSYCHADINSDCNSEVPTFKGNPSAIRGYLEDLKEDHGGNGTK